MAGIRTVEDYLHVGEIRVSRLEVERRSAGPQAPGVAITRAALDSDEKQDLLPGT